MFFEEGAFLEIVSDYNDYFKEIMPFVRKFNISNDLLEELLCYQKYLVRKPLDKECLAKFSYDFHNYFKNIIKGNYSALEKKHCVLKIKPDLFQNELHLYAKEVVWFGRRRGLTVYNI